MDTLRVGKFEFEGRGSIVGDLLIDGSNTRLRLHDQEAFSLQQVPTYITGTLVDGTLVTLLDCVPHSISTRSAEKNVFSTYEVFPHYIVEGQQHLPADEQNVRRLHVLIQDATSLFHDYGAFGTIVDPGPIMDSIIDHEHRKFRHRVNVGPHPHIAYFSGKSLIIEVETHVGILRAHHRPSLGFGGPAGAPLGNEIWVTLDLSEALSFAEGYDRLTRIIRLMELLIGREQDLRELHISVGCDDGCSTLKVQHTFSSGGRKEGQESSRTPQPLDVLLSPVHRPAEFEAVLKEWILLDTTRRDARQRFDASFRQAHRYSIDRLVSAANMFDILPDGATPADVTLSEQMEEAKRSAHRTFRALPESPERNSMLAALGRLGKASLKEKVRYRASRVLESTARSSYPRFDKLNDVLDEAVTCRNYFVHGTQPHIDTSKIDQFLTFFVDSLEFVFATSDLIDCGWDISAWTQGGTTMSHPFGSYLVNYSQNARALLNELGDCGTEERTQPST